MEIPPASAAAPESRRKKGFAAIREQLLKTFGGRLAIYLLVLTAAALVLAGLGVFPWWPTIVHAVALPPFDVFHDARVFMGLSVNYPGFALGLAATVVLRAAALSWLIEGGHRRRFLRRFRFMLLFYVLALPWMLLAAGASFAAGATLFYGFFWAGFLLAVAVFVVMAPMPWAGSFAFWRYGTYMAAAAGYVAAQAAVGVLAGVSVAGALAVSAVVTASFIVLLRRRQAAWLYALAAPLTVFLIWLFVVVGTGPAQPRYDMPLAEVGRSSGSLLLMSGIDSSSGNGAIFEVDPRAFGFSCGQTYYFSYAGPGGGAPQGDAACPIRTGAPYGPADTYRSLDKLVPEFAAQLSTLPPPVTVVAHSQGVWVVHEALTTAQAPGVERAAYVGPFPDNWVGYPLRGKSAPGLVGRGVLQAVSGIARPGGTAAFSPDLPLAEEVLASPAAVDTLMRRPPPGDAQLLSVMSVFDLPLIVARELPYASNACPVAVIHPNLPYAPQLHSAVRGFTGGASASCPTLSLLLGAGLRPFGPVPNDTK